MIMIMIASVPDIAYFFEMSRRQRNLQTPCKRSANAVKAQCTQCERRESAVEASLECIESPTRTPYERDRTPQELRISALVAVRTP